EELFLVFQPQYTTYSKKLRGFESLLRWKSGKLGTISPGDFIPIAEEMGYINLLGKWVLEESCKKLKLWHDTYNTDINMSINISAVQINDPSFLNIVYKILKDTGVNPKCLEFEITESIFVSTMDYATDVLNKLKELGIKIALDDFGKGYSSLSYICSFPIDSLKIDKSFIDDITTNEKKDSIVGSIISLVHDLDISVISEGIETTEQLQCLKCHSCDYIQGFLWGKPLFEEAAENLLSEQNNVIC
ncbi:MAG: EAL domain-containing protein, partial [Bacillota bacterium]|nr:EAL domain-containing protein [Bacillota bacterium]